MSTYLCYDIRGIQSFIFRIPKLKYIIGGSALIDQFDRETAPKQVVPGSSHLFSGGGKGTYACDTIDIAHGLRDKLVLCAHEFGADIRFGVDPDYTKASRGAQELYPFSPDSLKGKPCPKSGLYPVEGQSEHKVVKKRIISRGEPMFRYFEKRFGANDTLLPGVDPARLNFFHNVNAADDSDTDTPRDGSLGAKALGNRNRWAVICMDGNDMGAQLRTMTEKIKPDEEKLKSWVTAMSEALDECSKTATQKGIQRVVSEWAATADYDSTKTDGPVILPIRPLVVGGDDITVLCHVSHAMTFVEEACRVFAETAAARRDAFCKENPNLDLWPATGGEITISAGVLYCPVSLPLHTAVGYAELLLASAKARGRKPDCSRVGAPAPACIDWDQITDTVIDTPAGRRQREMVFTDEVTKHTVTLTTRPCTLDEYRDIRNLADLYKNKKIPASLCQEVLPHMRAGLSDRLAFIARIAKSQPILAGHLAEKGYPVPGTKEKSCWVVDGTTQKTPVVDAILLLEEISRMKKETTNV